MICPRYCDRVNQFETFLTEHELPSFIFGDGLFDLKKPLDQFCKGELVVAVSYALHSQSHLVDPSQAYRHLYMGPSSVHDDPGTVRSGGRPSITDIYALGFHIQPEMIATVCCLVRHYCSGLHVTR